MMTAPASSLFLVVVVLLTRISSAGKIGMRLVEQRRGDDTLQIQNIGSSAFDVSKLASWHSEKRFPLIAARNNTGGTCNKNIYNANCVNNGKSTWNCFFGGWDGVSSCHDSVSAIVTEDTFGTLSKHVHVIDTGTMVHVNNPSAIKVDQQNWMMAYTQLIPGKNVNKPGLSTSADGLVFNPGSGGRAFINMSGYEGWDAADVNGGNVLYHENGTLHLFFIDFKDGSKHVFRAAASMDAPLAFKLQNTALTTASAHIVNDFKLMGGKTPAYLMGLHNNGNAVYTSTADAVDGTFTSPRQLFAHRNDQDLHIVSLGFVVDETADRLLGAVYGAGANADLAHNSVFASWLQKHVLFAASNGDVLFGGSSTVALGPDALDFSCNYTATGKFYVYDSDYVDVANRGTLIYTSPQEVQVNPGDVWRFESDNAPSLQKDIGWTTCGGLAPAYNRTACPLAATCCKQKWMPSDGSFGCCPYPNATCCSNGYTCCPQGMQCNDTGSGWGVVTQCVSVADTTSKPADPADPDNGLGAQVCKTGANMPFSKNKKNVIIMGDSVSIGYTPKVQIALQDLALVQHSPWGGDGGAEETEYGFRCLEYLLRSPSGQVQAPDVLFFNWGLHNVQNQTIPGQAGPIDFYAPYLEKIAARLALLPSTTELIFGLTSPELCDASLDAVVKSNNIAAKAIMEKHGIPVVDMHAAIVGKCGSAPVAECFGSKGCFCPHCPANDGLGYAWLANTTIAPAILKYL